MTMEAFCFLLGSVVCLVVVFVSARQYGKR